MKWEEMALESLTLLSLFVFPIIAVENRQRMRVLVMLVVCVVKGSQKSSKIPSKEVHWLTAVTMCSCLHCIILLRVCVCNESDVGLLRQQVLLQLGIKHFSFTYNTLSTQPPGIALGLSTLCSVMAPPAKTHAAFLKQIQPLVFDCTSNFAVDLFNVHI